jgi:hypothetical protein
MNAWVKPGCSRIKAMAGYQRQCSPASSGLKERPEGQSHGHREQAHQHTANDDERGMAGGPRSDIALAVRTGGGCLIDAFGSIGSALASRR